MAGLRARIVPFTSTTLKIPSGGRGRRLGHPAKTFQIEPREGDPGDIVLGVLDGKCEIDPGFPGHAADLIFTDRESPRFPGEPEVQPVAAIGLVPPGGRVAE